MTKTNKNSKAIKSTEEVTPIIPATNGMGLAELAELEAGKAAAVKELAELEAAEIKGLRRTTSAEKSLIAKKATIVEETDHNGTVIENAVDQSYEIEDELAARKLQVNIDLAAAVKAEEDGTNSKDAVALEIARIMNDDTMSDIAKWATISKLASSKVDESIITDLSLLSDAEIMRRLRLLWSKRVAAKKNNDLVALADIATAEEELQSFRTKTTSRRSGTVSADVDPTTLSQENLNKLIRNVQSKKCTAKKAGLVDEVAIHQAEEDKLKAMRTGEPSVKGPSAMSLRILDTIAALEALPQSDVVDAQIAMLKTLA